MPYRYEYDQRKPPGPPMAGSPSISTAKSVDKEKAPSTRVALCNPCGCWALKDGCITVAIWTVIYAILQLGLYSWQTKVVQLEKDRSANSRAEWFAVLRKDDPRFPAYYETYYQTPEEKFYMGIFIVQIVQLIACFFLLGAGAALIWGIQSQTKHLLWPYFPALIVSVLAAGAYAALWLASPEAPSDPERLQTIKSIRERIPYWAIMTAFELITMLANIYCFVVIVSGYLRLSAGTLKAQGYYLQRSDQIRSANSDEGKLSSKMDTATTYDNLSGAGGGPGIYETKITGIDPLAGPNLRDHPLYAQAAARGIWPGDPLGPLPGKDPIPPDPEPFGDGKPKTVKQAFTEHWLSTVEIGAEPPTQAPPPYTKSCQSRSTDRRSRGRRHRRGKRSNKDYDTRSCSSGLTGRGSGRHRRRRGTAGRHRSYSSTDESETYYSSGYDDDDTDVTYDSDGYTITTASKDKAKRRRPRQHGGKSSGGRKKEGGSRYHSASESSEESYSGGQRRQQKRQQPPGGVPKVPGGAGVMPGPPFQKPPPYEELGDQVLTIPQHITLPPLSPADGGDKDAGKKSSSPKKYQINSNITIRYKQPTEGAGTKAGAGTGESGPTGSGAQDDAGNTNTATPNISADYSSAPTLDAATTGGAGRAVPSQRSVGGPSLVTKTIPAPYQPKRGTTSDV